MLSPLNLVRQGSLEQVLWKRNNKCLRLSCGSYQKCFWNYMTSSEIWGGDRNRTSSEAMVGEKWPREHIISSWSCKNWFPWLDLWTFSSIPRNQIFFLICTCKFASIQYLQIGQNFVNTQHSMCQVRLQVAAFPEAKAEAEPTWKSSSDTFKKKRQF